MSAVGRARAEIAAVLLAAAVHLAATLWWRLPGLDIAVIGGAFAVYVAATLRRADGRARAARAWGLGRAGLGPCARAAAVALLCGAAVIAAIGAGRGTLVVDWHLLPLLALYPLWGVVQQVLVLGLVAHNLDAIGVARPWTVAAAAVGFAAVHLPDLPLCAATAALGVVNALLFFAYRNVLPLAVLHGWLGALFYRWALGRDVWLELTG